MLCHVAHFKHLNKAYWGIVVRLNSINHNSDTTKENDCIYALNHYYQSTSELLNDKNEIFEIANNDLSKLTKFKVEDITFLSPILGSKRVICQGANYRQHMIESGMNPDKQNYNMFFNKSSAAICSAVEEVIKPSHVSLLDYEIELGLVIGKPITQKTEVNEKNISEYISAIVIANDISARDIQIPQTQFFKGKSYRTFCPVGPYLCLLNEDSVGMLNNLELSLKVNGKLRQKDNTKNLVFKPAETLTELSSFSDIDTGDLILTGTPSGCALQIPSPIIVKFFSLLPESIRWSIFKKIQSKSPKYLKKGDFIEAKIVSRDDKINLGVQQNIINDEVRYVK